MLMKLWVDDIRPIPDDSWTLARTINEAIKFLYLFDNGADPITEVSLDHDISHQVTVGEVSRPYPCEETFEAVAHYIIQTYRVKMATKKGVPLVPDLVPKITIHTANPLGGKRMATLFQDNGIPCTVKPMQPVNRLERVGRGKGD